MLDYLRTEDGLVADVPSIPVDKLVISPSNGRYVPLPAEIFTTEGEWVEVGTSLAEIHEGISRVPVISHSRGWVMRPLALPGQPVVKGQRLFWIREFDG